MKTQTGTIPFTSIDWSIVEKTIHPGETGFATWQTLHWPGLRVRLVNYSPGYKADHWCQLGHIVHCLSGTLVSEMEHGNASTLSEGMSYVVSDGLSSHRSTTVAGATLLIVDGKFLATT